MKKGQRRVKSSELKNRLITLEAIYKNQRSLAQKLNISVSTLRNYRNGKNISDKLYKQINKLYTQNKKKATTEPIQQKIKKIKNRITTERRSTHYIPIYPNYMYSEAVIDFRNVKDFYRLEELHEKGYIAGYYGTKQIPTEVQFLIHGEKLSRFGNKVKIVGIITYKDSPKLNEGYTAIDTYLKIYEVKKIYISGFKKELDYDKRMDILRKLFFETKIKAGKPLAFLGYYFEEGDEI